MTCGFDSVLVTVVLMLVVFCHVGRGQNWSIDDFSLFDLVEELENKNFYEDILNIKQGASIAEVKRAYRKLSLIYHPDKNKEPDAAEKFRQLAAVYEVLKDEDLRKKYDDVLEYGLPDWRQPIFYYRSVRKMPWWETALLLLVILTVGQYLMLWGSYVEQMLTVQEDIDRLKRKEKKYKKQNIDVNDLIDDLKENRVEKPSLRRLLPVVLLRLVVRTACLLPCIYSCCIAMFSKSNAAPVEESEDEESVSKQKKRPVAVFEEALHFDVATDLKPVSMSTLPTNQTDAQVLEQEVRAKTQEWSVEETVQLIRLTTTKYPTGTPNRWEKIATVLRRKPEDVTSMVGRLKHMDQQDYQKLSSLANSFQWSSSGSGAAVSSELKDESQGAGEESNDDDQWTQSQQKLFETALQQFPKGTSERWDKISQCVPGKSKEQCLLRFKFLANMVRNRKVQPK